VKAESGRESGDTATNDEYFVPHEILLSANARRC